MKIVRFAEHYRKVVHENDFLYVFENSIKSKLFNFF